VPVGAFTLCCSAFSLRVPSLCGREVTLPMGAAPVETLSIPRSDSQHCNLKSTKLSVSFIVS